MSASVVASNNQQRQITDVDDKEVVLLNKDVAEMYDEGLFEDVWGDQLHHGFYDDSENVDHNDSVSLASAQIRMIEEALTFAGLSGKRPERIVDVGCGVGGSSRYFAKKYGTKSCGITLSPAEVHKAQSLSAAQGFLAEQVSFQVADALNQPFPDKQFDLIWSLECSEHIPDRAKFVSELVRVAAPGATIIIVASCHRDLGHDEKSLKPDEKALLDKICKSFHLPHLCSAADYVNLLKSHNVKDIKRADWSRNVAPFWPAVIRGALKWKGITSLLRTGWNTMMGVLAMRLMIEGHKKDVIKYNIITCKTPE